MKKVYVIEPDYPGVEEYDFKIDTEFESEEEAKKYCKENSIKHYHIDDIIPHWKFFISDVMARLPYGVKFHIDLGEGKYRVVAIGGEPDFPHLDYVYTYWMRRGCYIPYLRPLSSMTDDERDKFRNIGGIMAHNVQNDTWALSAFTPEAYDWLISHHFDFRDLIPMGLALEAPKDLYKTE